MILSAAQNSSAGSPGRPAGFQGPHHAEVPLGPADDSSDQISELRPKPGTDPDEPFPKKNPKYNDDSDELLSGENLEFVDAFDERLDIEGEEKIRISGHLKNLFVSHPESDFTGENRVERAFSNLTRLRLTLDTDPYASLIFHGDLDHELFYSDRSGSSAGALGQGSFGRLYNEPFGGGLTHSLSSDTDFSLRWHRLYLKYTVEKFTVTAGRQLVRFGSGKLWNPLDILNPITPSSVEGADENRGIDALRVEYFPGLSTELSFVYAPNRENDRFGLDTLFNKNTNLVLRLRTTVGDTDLAVLAGRTGRKDLVGGDVAAVIKEGILRGSIIQAFPDDDASFVLGSLGYEYTFRNGIYFLTEYFYNGNAVNDNLRLAGMIAKAALWGITEETYPFIANQFITFNSHYLGISLGYDLTPLLRGDMFAMYDIKGKGLFLSPSLRYNLLENFDLSVSAMFGITPEDPERPSDFDRFDGRPLVHAYFQFFF